MLRSIATVSLSGTLEEKLQAAAAARFDAVEIFESDFRWRCRSAGGGANAAVRMAARTRRLTPVGELLALR